MKKYFLFACVSALLLFCAPVRAEEISSETEARDRVVSYALQIYDYVWTLPEEQGPILLYNCNYGVRTNGFRVVFDRSQPYVVYGTVRGIPYSLATYSNGRDLTFEQYLALTDAQRAEIANIYNYPGYGKRISMRYGMSCATFLSDCLRRGLQDDALPVQDGVRTLLSDTRWKKYFTFGKRGWKDYEALQPGDFITRDGHAMLIIENLAKEQRMRVMEQTPPDYAVANCENITDVTVTLIHRGKPTQLQAKRLCMECAACRQATTGTQCRWVDYTELVQSEYRAVFVKY